MEKEKLSDAGFIPLAKAAGFTLVEIMIVIAIIATLAAIAVPIFLTSRINANEASAILSARTILSACQSYYTNTNPHTFPQSLENLVAPDSDPPYLDSILAVRKEKQGYRFDYVFGDSENFELNAEPTSPGMTGNRYFFSDETGIIKAKSGGKAGASDPPIE